MTAAIFDPARVWLRRRTLDRELAHGADPGDSVQLARRAYQLNVRRYRSGLAAGIYNLLDAAEEPARSLSASVPLQRGEILAESPLLLAIARDLNGHDRLSPRGIALIKELLTDGGSPVYAPHPAGSLHAALVHARAALHLS
jgi:hypothetical protein